MSGVVDDVQAVPIGSRGCQASMQDLRDTIPGTGSPERFPDSRSPVVFPGSVSRAEYPNRDSWDAFPGLGIPGQGLPPGKLPETAPPAELLRHLQ